MSDTSNLVGYAESFVFIMLLIASIIALAVGIERTLIFKKNTNKKIDIFVRELIESFRSRDIKAVIGLIKDAGDNVYTRFAQFSIQQAEKNGNDLPELMSGKIIEEKIFFEKRLTILNTLGNNAPFIGLLGTVLGVIKAFYGLGTLGSMGAEVVMRSISSALLATAAGLFIAIPVVMANNYFSKKVKTIIQHLEIFSKEINVSLRTGKQKINE
jgi:biopolymer transport protein ExbB